MKKLLLVYLALFTIMAGCVTIVIPPIIWTPSWVVRMVLVGFGTAFLLYLVVPRQTASARNE